MVMIAAPMASSGGSGITLLLPLILIVGMIWFMSRTQRKQRARQAQTVAALVPGTRVITTSGQLGTVEEVDDEYVTLEIADGVSVQFVKQAIGRVLPDEVDEYEEEEDLEDEDLEDVEDEADESVQDAMGDKPRAARDKVDDRPTLPPTHTEN
ncbi:MAG TPA: preprotein translocase subunit YajC [Kribbella sp.]|nr:preprotein translocase subunit YajC [Kribbella sp.]